MPTRQYSTTKRLPETGNLEFAQFRIEYPNFQRLCGEENEVGEIVVPSSNPRMVIYCKKGHQLWLDTMSMCVKEDKGYYY